MMALDLKSEGVNAWLSGGAGIESLTRLQMFSGGMCPSRRVNMLTPRARPDDNRGALHRADWPIDSADRSALI
jgi:hypothetical protein